MSGQPPPEPVDVRAPLVLGAVVALGQAIQEGNGALYRGAMGYATAALLLSLGAVVLGQRRWTVPELAMAGLATLGIGFQIAQLLTRPPGIYLQLGPDGFTWYYRALAFAAVLGGVVCFAPARARWGAGLLVLAVHFALGVWLIQSSPHPHIDVFYFQRDSLNALLEGRNPYALTFADIYSPAQSAQFYGPGLSVGGRLQFGFPYPPASLLLALPGHLIAGDYRYSQLGAMTLAGALLMFSRPDSRWGAVAAVLLLFTPRGLFVLEQGWTEPFLVLALAAVLLLAHRRPRWGWIPLGLLVGVKQYVVVAAPLLWLLPYRPWREQLWPQLWRGGLLAAVVTLPFVVWDARAFIFDVVLLQLRQPFRPDALSYLAWLKQVGVAPPGAWVAFVVSLLLVGVCLFRAERSIGGFALSCAVVLFGFFVFNKQAFANYYYFVVGALACALAWSAPLPDRQGSESLAPQG